MSLRGVSGVREHPDGDDIKHRGGIDVGGREESTCRLHGIRIDQQALRRGTEAPEGESNPGGGRRRRIVENLRDPRDPFRRWRLAGERHQFHHEVVGRPTVARRDRSNGGGRRLKHAVVGPKRRTEPGEKRVSVAEFAGRDRVCRLDRPSEIQTSAGRIRQDRTGQRGIREPRRDLLPAVLVRVPRERFPGGASHESIIGGQRFQESELASLGPALRRDDQGDGHAGHEHQRDREGADHVAAAFLVVAFFFVVAFFAVAFFFEGVVFERVLPLFTGFTSSTVRSQRPV